MSQTASRLATIPRIIFDFLKSESDSIVETITSASASPFYDDCDTLSTISFLLHTYLFENLNIHPNAKKEFTSPSNIQQTLQDNLLVLTQFIVCELHCRIGSKISESLFSVNNNNNNNESTSLGSNFLQFRSTIAFMARKEFFERANQNIQEMESKIKNSDDDEQDYEIHYESCEEEEDDDSNNLFCGNNHSRIKDDEDSNVDRFVLPCSPLADTMRVITPEELIFALMLNNTSNSSNLNGESFQSSFLVFEEIVAECLYSQILVHRVAYSSVSSSFSKMKNILFLLEPLLVQRSMTKEQLQQQKKEAMNSSRHSSNSINGRTASVSPPSSLSSSTFSSSSLCSIEGLLSKKNITRAEFFDNSMLSSPSVIFPVSSFSRRMVADLISECAKTTTVSSLLPHYQQRRKNFHHFNSNDPILFTKKSQLNGEKVFQEFLRSADESIIISEDFPKNCVVRPQLGVPFMDSIFTFCPGTVNEIYGEAGCGKSTWAAQLLMHTVAQHVSAIMMTSQTLDEEEFVDNSDDADFVPNEVDDHGLTSKKSLPPSRDVRVLYLCAEPPSMERINQIAEHEAIKILKNCDDEQEETKKLLVDALISRLLLLNVMSVDHFESTVRDLTSISNNYSRAVRDHDIPLIILDSVAALIEKSLDDNTHLYDEDCSSNKNTNTNKHNNSSRTENIRQAMKRQELIERVGTSLSELTKIRNFCDSSSTSTSPPPTIIVINQARSASFSNSATSQESFSKISSNQSRPSFLANKLMMMNSNNSNLFGSTTTSLPPRPALGYSWSTFISGMSIELTKCLQPMMMARGSEGGTVRQKRRARMMKNSHGKIYERRADYEIVASGIQENSLL